MNIVVYTKPNCSYCVRAKQLLERKSLSYQEIRVDQDPVGLQELERSGRKTVPQIFINDKAIGGFDDLYELEKSGRLDELIK